MYGDAAIVEFMKLWERDKLQLCYITCLVTSGYVTSSESVTTI